MATVTKTFVENVDTSTYHEGNFSTWYLSFTGSDVTANGNTLTFTFPTSCSAKFGEGGSTYRKSTGTATMSSWKINIGTYEQSYSSSALAYEGTHSSNTSSAWFTYSIPRGGSAGSLTVNTSDIFTSSNKFTKTVNVSMTAGYIKLRSRGIYDYSGDSYYQSSAGQIWSNIATVTLNVPPTFDVTAISKDTSVYVAGLTTVSVTVSNATAYYGGDISSAKLTIGSQEATISGNGTISMMLQNTGTFTPVVTVTDSRRQTKTENLASITVIPYEKPSVDFDIFRTDEDGIKSDEGNYGVIAANLTYMGEVANLTEPTISINNTLLTNYYAKTLDTVVDNNKTYYTYSEGSYTVVANPIDADIDLYYEKANITWYLNYNSQTGVSTLITNWSQVGSNNTATIYGLIDACFAALESYQITFVETDSLNGQSEAITQMLSTAFYTIDFQAGGKEIAFGAPANDDITDINGTDYSDEGLFKCAMGTSFNDMEQTEINQFISDLDISGSPIELTQADWVVEQGITGDWTWRKWQSGIAECWGMFLHNTTVSGAWGNGFLSNVKVINFPTDLFVSPPSGMSAYVDSTWAGLSACENQIATKDWMRCYIFRTSSTGTTATDFYIHVDAKGRWK